MRKSEGPWYRKFNNTWYSTVHGNKLPLGKHPEGAPPPKKGKRGWNAPDAILTAFHRLMAADTPQPLKPADTRVIAILDLFLDHSQRHNKPRTYEWYKSFLQDFRDRYGRLKVEDLKPFHVKGNLGPLFDANDLGTEELNRWREDFPGTYRDGTPIPAVARRERLCQVYGWTSPRLSLPMVSGE